LKRKEIVPSQTERFMRDDDFIVSKTDIKGLITYGNPIFIEFSGYTEADLIGSQHNIVRHPDMPRAAFKLAWDTIQSGQEFFGYVKNMAQDGSFYWVFAHITPDHDHAGHIIGYTSVRRCPKRSSIEAISPVYKMMRDAEQAAGAREALSAGTQVLIDVLQKKGMSYAELVFAL
jgi:PAS domain S-box-containing protein